MLSIENLTATEIAEGVRSGKYDPVEIAEAVIKRTEEIEPMLNAFITWEPDEIREQARALKDRRNNGDTLGLMAGVPFAIKGSIAIKGKPATSALIAFKDEIADRDAALYTRMIEADGIFVGQTTLPEAGYAGVGESHLYGATHNPWKKGYSAGGSSTGSAAAVAAGIVPIAEGSDGAGSIRIPASACGVVGFKPSFGRIPTSVLPTRYETWVFHGPLTRTVDDAALMYHVMSGPADEDPLTLPDDGTNYLQAIQEEFESIRIAYSPDLGTGYDIDPEVAKVAKEATEKFKELGATVVEDTPNWEGIEKAFWESIWVPGFSSERHMIDWDSWEGQVDPELVAMLKESDSLTVARYGEANLVRAAMWDEYVRFMQDYDFIVSPTLTHPAHKHGQFAPDHLLGRSVREQLLGWLLTYPFNMLTVPAISMPAGFTSEDLPVGLQIAGKQHADKDVLRIARQFEQVHNLWNGPLATAPDFTSFH